MFESIVSFSSIYWIWWNDDDNDDDDDDNNDYNGYGDDDGTYYEINSLKNKKWIVELGSKSASEGYTWCS